MSVHDVPTQLSVEHLLKGVKQLSSTELWEFTKKLTEWQEQRKAVEEAGLLAAIQENSRLPEKEHQRYRELWRKCEGETINASELNEYQTLLSQLEARNVKRIEALIALAKLRGKTLREVIAELDVKEENDAF